MGNISVTAAKVLKFEHPYTAVVNAATEDVGGTSQTFIITPTTNDNKLEIRATVANSHGSVSAIVKAGDFWMGVDNKTIECVQNATTIFQLETAKYLQSDGTIEIEFDPAGSKQLTTNHALKVEVVELR